MNGWLKIKKHYLMIVWIEGIKAKKKKEAWKNQMFFKTFGSYSWWK